MEGGYPLRCICFKIEWGELCAWKSYEKLKTHLPDIRQNNNGKWAKIDVKTKKNTDKMPVSDFMSDIFLFRDEFVRW